MPGVPHTHRSLVIQLVWSQTHKQQEIPNLATKIRLKRLGKIRSPHYRIVVMDSRSKRDGQAIEEIGLYHPKNDPSLIRVNSERAQYWLSVGAQPTEAVVAIFKRSGDWQKFTGEDTPLRNPSATRAARPRGRVREGPGRGWQCRRPRHLEGEEEGRGRSCHRDPRRGRGHRAGGLSRARRRSRALGRWDRFQPR